MFSLSFGQDVTVVNGAVSRTSHCERRLWTKVGFKNPCCVLCTCLLHTETFILIKKLVELSEVSLLGKIYHFNDSMQFWIDLVVMWPCIFVNRLLIWRMAHPLTEAILELNLKKLKILCEEKEEPINDISSLFPNNTSEARLVCVHPMSMAF